MLYAADVPHGSEGLAEPGSARAEARTPAAWGLAARARAVHVLLAPWLAQPGVSLACGRWSDGAISELMLGGKACLLPERYDGPFAGIRELRLADAQHHLHVDLGRVERVAFAIAPSVCLGFKPSLEVRLLTQVQPQEWTVSLMLQPPYDGDRLDLEAVTRFLELACRQMQAQPDLTQWALDPGLTSSKHGQALLGILDAATTQAGLSMPATELMMPAARPDDPLCLPLLRQALTLADASLVIFRERSLVEFKTDHLDGVHRLEENGHVSWQLGAFQHHHCHLALEAVTRVVFSAEPVPCQGGGLNYTVWFQTAWPAGNPHRPHGYFSVTLNRPYLGNVSGAAPRLEVIKPVLDLYRRYAQEPWVEIDDAFQRVLENGPPARP
ncbi:MAG: hypothetical protein HZB72_06770 [Burkholderiales bacterium]|nr:hypothetical protein [Burkholderiales bacterium]